MWNANENSWRNQTETYLSEMIDKLNAGGSQNVLALSFRLSQDSKQYLSAITLNQGFAATWSHVPETGDKCTLNKIQLTL